MAIITCTNCGKPVSSEAENCIHCKEPLVKSVMPTGNPASVKNTKIHNDTQELGDEKIDRYRYPALRFIAGVYLVLAILAVVGAVAAFVLIGDKIGLEWGLVYFVVSLFFALLILAISESIKVFLDIEYNTRKTAHEIKRIRD